VDSSFFLGHLYKNLPPYFLPRFLIRAPLRKQCLPVRRLSKENPLKDLMLTGNLCYKTIAGFLDPNPYNIRTRIV
jgi:hypothetical protein